MDKIDPMENPASADSEKNSSCLLKQENIIKIFQSCPTAQDKYEKLIEMGRNLPSIESVFKTTQNIVQGCQSTMYLRAYLSEEGKVLFEAESEALISAGLAALLIDVYSDETPEVILKCPPNFLDEIGIKTSLTPGRSNGLASMFLRMKQEALNLLLKKP